MLAAIPFADYDEAVAIANSVEYGLTASVFTRDLRTAMAFSRDVEAGYVWVNETARHFLGAPFGGVKNSGVGREEDLERDRVLHPAQERQHPVRLRSERSARMPSDVYSPRR